MIITALIPAHNEQKSLASTIRSLQEQTIPPSRIIVASDNSTDGTVRVARDSGVEVFETIDNTFRKAGALNQALKMVDTELVLCVDADTNLVPNFIELALTELQDGRVGAVGGVFSGRNPQSLLEYMQANEYNRYSTEIHRTKRVSVLSGTAALIRVEALQEIARSRGNHLPGLSGDVYDRNALTEDSELTIALKTLNYTLKSPVECGCDTELMPTWGDLMQQRVRWYRGAMENLAAHGFNHATARYWRQQVMLGLSTFTYFTYIIATLFVIGAGDIQFSWFWTGIGFIFWIERQITLTKPSIKGRLISAAMLPEMFYALILQIAFVSAIWKVVRKTNSQWTHLEEEQCITLTEAF